MAVGKMELLTKVLWPFWLIQLTMVNLVKPSMNYDGQKVYPSEPYFKGFPVDVAILEGENAIFNCFFGNLQGDEIIFWTKNEYNLSDNLVEHLNIRISRNYKQGDFTMVIERAKFEDEGAYQCHLMSRHGPENFLTINSTVGKLTVEELPSSPVIFQGPLIEAKEGEYIELECSCSGGKPAPKIIWRKENGKQISNMVETEVMKKSGYLFSDQTTVRLKDITRSILTYKVRRKNPEGKRIIICQIESNLTSAVYLMNTTIEIKILSPPKLKMEIKSQNQNDGGRNESLVWEFEDVMISCKVISEGPQKFKFTWLMNSENIDVAMKNSCKNYHWNMSDENKTMNIYIEKVTRRFHGSLFQCQVWNPNFNVGTAKTLEIKYDPSEMRLPEQIIPDKNIGDDLELNCDAELAQLTCNERPEFIPSPKITWYHKDIFGSPRRFIPAATRTVIMKIENHTFGDYECVSHYQHFPVISTTKVLTSSSVKSDDNVKKVAQRYTDFVETTITTDILKTNYTTVSQDTILPLKTNFLDTNFTTKVEDTPFTTALPETNSSVTYGKIKINLIKIQAASQEPVDPRLYVVIILGVIVILLFLVMIVCIIVKCQKGYYLFCKGENQGSENSSADSDSDL